MEDRHLEYRAQRGRHGSKGHLSLGAIFHRGEAWESAFWLPVVFALLVAAFAWLTIRDTPESLGLPSIEEHRNDPAKVEVEKSQLPYWSIVLRHVILNPVMIYLALANVFVYALHYGVLSWTPIYLSEVHHASITKGIAGFSI